MRDHCFLNACYQRMAVKWLDKNLPGWGHVVKRYLCGDDVDLIMSDENAIVPYMLLI